MAEECLYDNSGIDWKGVGSHYKLEKHISDWEFQKENKEQVLNLINPDVITSETDQLDFKGDWITYYDILASRCGIIPSDSFFQLAAYLS